MPAFRPLPPDSRRSNRRAILDAVTTDPGITKTELADALGLGWGTVCHHVLKLEQRRLVRTFRHGRNAHFFPATTRHERMEWIAVRRRPPVQHILALLDQRREVNVPAIMQGVGVSRHVAKSALDAMERVGLVERVGRGHARYRVPDVAWASHRSFPGPAAFDGSAPVSG